MKGLAPELAKKEREIILGRKKREGCRESRLLVASTSGEREGRGKKKTRSVGQLFYDHPKPDL